MPKERNKITIKPTFGIVKQPSKDMYRVRRTAVRPIGTVTVLRKNCRSALSGTNWRPMAAMPRHSLLQAGF